MFLWDKKKYPFNILDADMMAGFNEAEKNLWKELNDYEREHATDGRIDADGIKAECRIMDRFFDTVFGEGTAEEMFGRDHDLEKRVKAVKKLYKVKNDQLEEHDSRVRELGKLVFGKEEIEK